MTWRRPQETTASMWWGAAGGRPIKCGPLVFSAFVSACISALAPHCIFCFGLILYCIPGPAGANKRCVSASLYTSSKQAREFGSRSSDMSNSSFNKASRAQFRAGAPWPLGVPKRLNKAYRKLVQLLMSEHSQHLPMLYVLLWPRIVFPGLAPNYIGFLGRLAPQINVRSASLYTSRSQLMGSCFVQKPPNLHSIRVPSGTQTDSNGTQNPKYTAFLLHSEFPWVSL